MDKRFQVFVSSTYTDLIEERQAVMQTLMEMDCIPAGMELFPAADEDQFEFIKRIIDDCDYYLIIIGGRYGSLAADGLSFTEKEYDYALSRGLRVIALVHSNSDQIIVGKSEKDKKSKIKLEKFRSRVCKGRMVKFWDDKSQISGILSPSLSKTIKLFPAIGWVRASQVASVEILEEVNYLRKENDRLNVIGQNLSNFGKTRSILEKKVVIGIDVFVHDDIGGYEKVNKTSLEIKYVEIYRVISDTILGGKTRDSEVRNSLVSIFNEINKEDSHENGFFYETNSESFSKIRSKLTLLDLIAVDDKNFWTVTVYGKQLILEELTEELD